MILKGKAIQKTVLLEGSPEQIRVVEFRGGLIRLIELQYTGVSQVRKIAETKAAGALCLLGRAHESRRTVRIVACESLREQLCAEYEVSHSWDTAILVTLRFSFLDPALTPLLVYQLKRLVMENTEQSIFSLPGGIGPAPKMREAIDGRCQNLIEEIPLLAQELGYNLFASKPGVLKTEADLYFCESRGVYARGRPQGEGFLVLKGSTGRRANGRAPASTLQHRLEQEGVLRRDDQTVYFECPHLFENHAQAATAVLGHLSTGFFEWKHSEGLTLAEVMRADLARP